MALSVLLSLVTSADASPYSYATHALQLTDLGAGMNPQAINNTGQVVGQAANSQAFLWAGGTTTPLGTIGGTQSFGNDINDNGTAVGWSLDAGGAKKAFQWTSGTGMVNIEGSATLQSAAEAINNLGDIVGWKTTGTSTRSALWDTANPGGVLLFGSSGSQHKALGVNDDGEIVGVTTDRSRAITTMALTHRLSLPQGWERTTSRLRASTTAATPQESSPALRRKCSWATSMPT
jgi:probable HAF family extracellular repeat protein